MARVHVPFGFHKKKALCYQGLVRPIFGGVTPMGWSDNCKAHAEEVTYGIFQKQRRRQTDSSQRI